MQNKPLTKEEVKELGKGIHLHKFPNRKKRRSKGKLLTKDVVDFIRNRSTKKPMGFV